MAGTVYAKPDIPGTLITFKGQALPHIVPQAGQTVAVPIIGDWGPLGSELTETEIAGSFAEWVERYGDSDTPGRTAVAGAFAGQSLPNSNGAGGVITYRMATDDAARSTHTILNTAGSPVAGFRVDALWAGERGDLISYDHGSDPDNSGANNRLRIRFKGAVVESYPYPKTQLDQLAAAMASSAWVRGTVLVAGVALAVVASPQALSGGDNGDTLTAAEWLDMLDGLEYQPFTIIAPYDLTDGAIQASLLSWVQSQVEENRPCVLVVGGAAGESVTTAATRSTALADPHVINLGIGTYKDDLFGATLSTSQLAPRIAGVLAARGITKALTGAKVGGLHVVGTTGATTDMAKAAIKAGVTTFVRSTSADADLRIAQGLTTFTSKTDTDRPYDVFSDPRLVRIMDFFVRGMKEWGDDNVIGNVPVNDDTRASVRGEALKRIDILLELGLILTKAQGAEQDPYVTTPITTDDTVPFIFGWQFARTANFVLGQGTVL